MDPNLVATLAGQHANGNAITWNTVILAAIQLATVVVTSVSAYFIARITKSTKMCAAAATEAKDSAILTGKKTDEISNKIVEIHTATNGNLSKLGTALEISAQKLEGMQTLLNSALESNKSQELTLARVRQEHDIQQAAHQIPQALSGPIISTGPVIRSVVSETHKENSELSIEGKGIVLSDYQMKKIHEALTQAISFLQHDPNKNPGTQIPIQ
jgi:hypothetical protein